MRYVGTLARLIGFYLALGASRWYCWALITAFRALELRCDLTVLLSREPRFGLKRATGSSFFYSERPTTRLL